MIKKRLLRNLRTKSKNWGNFCKSYNVSNLCSKWITPLKSSGVFKNLKTSSMISSMPLNKFPVNLKLHSRDLLKPKSRIWCLYKNGVTTTRMKCCLALCVSLYCKIEVILCIWVTLLRIYHLQWVRRKISNCFSNLKITKKRTSKITIMQTRKID